VIAIAHRLSTIARMDRLIVLEQGRIVEQGTHARSCFGSDGHYALLWKHQSGGFLPAQGLGEGLPGHVRVDPEAVVASGRRRRRAAGALSVWSSVSSRGRGPPLRHGGCLSTPSGRVAAHRPRSTPCFWEDSLPSPPSPRAAIG
jgi:hypothetical protein